MQILAEHGRLLHHALAPQGALIAVPGLAIAEELAGDRRDAPMDRALHALAVHIMVMLGRVLMHEQDMVEAAGQDQAREGTQPGEAVLALIFVQARMAKSRG